MDTVSICFDCVKACQIKLGTRIGGTFQPDTCQRCGQEKHLSEFRKIEFTVPNKTNETITR